MGRYDEALSIFQKLITDYPGSAIVPVTKLMIARVEKDKEDMKTQARRISAMDKDIITDPKTGAKYKRIAVLTGKKDVVEIPNRLILSPNGKLLLNDHIVIPLKEGEPFDLLEGKDGLRGIWSPDGKMAAYYSENAIWIVPVSPETGRPTGQAKKLLDGEYRFQGHVSWSPDSEKIVFTKRDEETQGDIWTLSIKDGTLTQITDDPDLEAHAKWSPDGKSIAYTLIRDGNEIRLLSAEGGKSKKIIRIEYGGVHSWSPDGKWLTYKARQKFHLFRLDDERVFAINPPDRVGHFFSWSPDGKKLLFYHSSYDWTSTLRVVSTSGGPSFRLARELELWPFRHFWTADSNTIITSRAGDSKFVMVPLTGGESIPIELDVRSDDNLQHLSLSPDRKSLLCSIELENGNEDLYTVPISLEEARATCPAVSVFKNWDRRVTRTQSSWSPDSKNIALIHKGDVWVTSAEEENPVQITKTPGLEYNPVWSPGGENIAYITEIEQGNARLMVVSASGGKPMTILNRFETWVSCWSPNGKAITVISDNKISIIPLVSGKSIEILNLEGKGFTERFWGLIWLPDGKHIAFAGEKEGDKGNLSRRIYIASTKTGKITELAADDKSWKDWIFLSPDGKWISYCTDGFIKTRSQATIWEVNVEELLREEKQ